MFLGNQSVHRWMVDLNLSDRHPLELEFELEPEFQQDQLLQELQEEGQEYPAYTLAIPNPNLNIHTFTEDLMAFNATAYSS